MLNEDLLLRIQNKVPDFSKGKKMIAGYINDHYEKAAYMTALKLGKTVGVSESTVVRFATDLGFEGYPQLQKALQDLIRNRLTSLQRMDVANDQIGNSDILKKVLNSDIENIKKTLSGISKENFEKAVKAIAEAEHIYILGVRSSAALASFLGYYFDLIFDNVRLVNTTSAGEMSERILRVKPNDVVIGISFPRYSSRTVGALRYASAQGARTIGITDGEHSPLSAHADYLLIAKSNISSFADSLVAPLSLLNALIVAIGMIKQEEISETFSRLERLWDEYEVYEKHKIQENGEPVSDGSIWIK